MPRIRRIMCASDFSPASRPAFVKAVEMAKTLRAPLIIAHVLAPFIPLTGEGYVTPDTWERIESGARSLAQKHLDVLLHTARRAGLRVTTVLEECWTHLLSRAALLIACNPGNRHRSLLYVYSGRCVSHRSESVGRCSRTRSLGQRSVSRSFAATIARSPCITVGVGPRDCQ